ncbi:hypothetical protein [Achromobacter pestifer]|uniref:Uncharacterized protein n=1 Tax=Achromobacter pestifer TaxID=1353889 RepID=A0A6S6Z0Q7_9BURK|nr:hypothetical protein [Achromobacter pestifer]CAB3647450.1 hypothetical protein LMG3431_02570 [Achromobacter pestifer]
MNAAIEWRKVDDYYWSGPPGWTICRVWLQGRYRHELWQSEGQPRLVGTGETFADAQRLYIELKA